MAFSFTRHAFVLFIFCISYGKAVLSLTESDCTKVRLDENGGPFQQLPIYDQTDQGASDTGMCYAISSSELIDAKRIQLGTFDGKRTSPISVALNWANGAIPSESLENNRQNREKYRQYLKQNLIEGRGIASKLVGDVGRIATAIEKNQNQKVCDDSWLKKQSLISSENHDQMLSQIFSLIEEQFEAELSLDRIHQKLLAISPQADSVECADARKDLSQLKDIIEAVKEAAQYVKPEQQAKAFMDRLCKDHFVQADVPTPKEFVCFTRACKEEQTQTLQKIISSPNFAGVGIHYDPEVLYKMNGPKDASHVSVIIGRQYDKESGQCQVLIRDSYGSECKPQDPEMKYKNCKNGQHWIPITEIIKSTAALTYFE